MLKSSSVAMPMRLLAAMTALWGIGELPAVVRAAPSEDQSYVGVKACSACHFEQYMTWKKNKHAKSFDELPAKYKTTDSCLKCHATGAGKPTGFKDQASTPELANNGCENCHGPGSEHVKTCKPLVGKKLTDDEKATAKASIWHLRPNVCADCHMAVTHRAHERFDKE